VRFSPYSSKDDNVKYQYVDAINGLTKIPSMITFHTCCDDQLGVADLIGVNIEEEDK
jgi:hypothetical protein